MKSLFAGVAPPAPRPGEERPGRFPLIDSLRAMAALSIFFFHASGEVALPQDVKQFTNTFAAGVPIFFVISGFVLYRPFAVAALEGDPPPTPAAYAWRRFLRIVPAFWLALTIYVVFGPRSESLSDLPLLYGFAQVYDPTTVLSGLAPAWSLNDEVVYYVMLPLAAMAAASLAGRGDRLRRQIAMVGALAVVSFAYKGWFFAWGGNPARVRDQVFLFQPGWNLDLFVLGMAVALWSAKCSLQGAPDRLARFVTRNAGASWALAAVIFVVLSLNSGQAFDRLGSVLLHVGRAAMALCIVLPAIWGRAGRGAVRRLLGWRPLLTLGVLSYSLYLFHKMWLDFVFSRRPAGFSGPGSDVVLIAIGFAGALATAYAVYVLVERPALSLRSFVPDRRPAAAVPPAPVAPEGRW